MTTGYLIITIIAFLLSWVAGALLTLAAGKLKPAFLRIFFYLHLTVISAAGVMHVFMPDNQLFGSLLLAGICSGLLLSGWALRSKFSPLVARYYLSCYLLTIPVFLYSPSLLFYCISGRIDLYHPAASFHLRGNTYLVEQQSMLQISESHRGYKVISKYGIYNKTLARDVFQGRQLIGATLVTLTDDTLIVKGILKDGTSLQIGLKPGMKRETITRKTP